MNTVTFESGNSLSFNELPEGYFYKNKFYPGIKCFSALFKDDEVKIHSFYNGTWTLLYNNTVYRSLKELHEWNEDYLFVSYKELKKRYKEFNIEHNPLNCTMYTYDRDDWNQLYSTKEEVLMEIRNETNLIENTEDREERYISDLSEEECVNYFKKSVKERLKILGDKL